MESFGQMQSSEGNRGSKDTFMDNCHRNSQDETTSRGMNHNGSLESDNRHAPRDGMNHRPSDETNKYFGRRESSINQINKNTDSSAFLMDMVSSDEPKSSRRHF